MSIRDVGTGTAISIRGAWELDWTPVDTARDGNVPGPVLKVLRSASAPDSLTFLLHVPPGWHDDVLDWHATTEESYVLEGAIELVDSWLDVGSYLYRPRESSTARPRRRSITARRSSSG